MSPHIDTLQRMRDDKARELAALDDALAHMQQRGITEATTIDQLRRYRLRDAAKLAGTSEATMRRRAAEQKLLIVHDGSIPYVMGAELARFMRTSVKARTPQRRRARA